MSSSTEPRIAEYVEELPDSPRHFDSAQISVVPADRTSGHQIGKPRFSVVFVILLAILTKGPQLLKLFQPQRPPAAPIARPVKEAKDPHRKLGEKLEPPRQPILDKFKKPNGGPPAVPDVKGE